MVLLNAFPPACSLAGWAVSVAVGVGCTLFAAILDDSRGSGEPPSDPPRDSRAPRDRAPLAEGNAPPEPQPRPFDSARDGFEVVLRQLPFAVVVAEAPGGSVFIANAAAERLYGRPLQSSFSLEEYSAARVFHPDGTPYESAEYPLVRALTRGDEISGEEMQIERKDGTRCPVLATAAPVRDDVGQIVAAVATFYDISDLKRTEQEHQELAERQRAARIEAEAAHTRLSLLAEISQFLLASLDYQAAVMGLARMILPALGDACFVDIDDGEQTRRLAIAHVNSQKAAMLQRLDDVGGLTALVGRPLATALRSGKPERGDRLTAESFRGVPADRLLWNDIVRAIDPRAFMVIPLVTRGRVLGAMVFLVTESDRKYSTDDLDFAQHVARRAATAVDNLRLYEDARQARLLAEDANRLKDEFLATLSHELRTPLNAILGWSRMLRAGKLDEGTRRKAVDTIERNGLAQAQIVDDLLDVSRIITGSLRLNLQTVDVGALIDAAITGIRPAIEAKGIRIRSSVEDIPAIVGDQGRLQQVVWNLVSNATKFTLPGGEIDVRVDREDGDVRLTVSDTGVGISPAFLPYVFERFRQADSTTTRAHGGLGLGLAIVRHLVELHGGTVQAESAGPGRGSTFTVRLPMRRAMSDAPARRTARGGASARTDASELEGVEVLVVDDEPDARELAAAILRDHGAIVETAESAEAAVESLDHFNPRVLVADIAMPGEDGYSLIRRLRRSHTNVPAVALTAYARPEDRNRALDAGFEVHLAKPVEPKDLVGAVADLSSRSKP